MGFPMVAAIVTQQTFFALIQHMSPQEAYAVLYGRVVEQANLWAFVSNFRFMIRCSSAWTSIALGLLL